jgi:hypothetical protein
MKMAVLCHVSPCSLVETDRLITLMKETVSTAEKSDSFYEATRHSIAQGSCLVACDICNMGVFLICNGRINITQHLNTDVHRTEYYVLRNNN